jgi:hypothetical protein
MLVVKFLTPVGEFLRIGEQAQVPVEPLVAILKAYEPFRGRCDLVVGEIELQLK